MARLLVLLLGVIDTHLVPLLFLNSSGFSDTLFETFEENERVGKKI